MMPSSIPSSALPRRGATLLELVAGLALLGGILVALLVARGRHLRQWELSQRRLEAITAADALLTQWWQKPEEFPRNATGRIPSERPLTWHTRTIPSEEAQRLNATIVRLELFEARSHSAPLASVEVLLPREEAN